MAALLQVRTAGGTRDFERRDLDALGGAFEFRRLAEIAGVPADATHATFHATDGYAASIPLAQAMSDGRIEVPDASLGRTGVRLIVADGSTTCLNVKAVTLVELTAGPGKHTVDPNPHKPARVAGWDR